MSAVLSHRIRLHVKRLRVHWVNIHSSIMFSLFLAAKSCPAPPGWGGDRRDRPPQEFHVGQSVRVPCPKGQQVRGSGTVSCRTDQTWSPVSAVCESTYLL